MREDTYCNRPAYEAVSALVLAEVSEKSTSIFRVRMLLLILIFSTLHSCA